MWCLALRWLGVGLVGLLKSFCGVPMIGHKKKTTYVHMLYPALKKINHVVCAALSDMPHMPYVHIQNHKGPPCSIGGCGNG